LPRTRSQHSQDSRAGVLLSWGNTPDWTARTAPARASSPSDVTYWLDRLDAERFAGSTDADRLRAADALRRAYFARLAAKSAKARARRSPDDPPKAA
jgi:hypothetical protein